MSRLWAVITAISLALCFSLHADAAPPRSGGVKSTRVTRAAEKARTRLAQPLSSKGLEFGAPILVRAFKEEAKLELWLEKGERYVLLKSYDICAASGELGPKQKVGDEQVPEGFYAVPAGAMNPASQYHLSFNVGYPNALDKALGRTGSLIMIHGDCVSVGCLAMTDDGIEEIYSLADAAHRAGQEAFQVQIFPFRMTPENMKRHAKSKWIKSWQDLKVGYDHFETKRVPPKVGVKDKRYTFGE